MSLSPYVKLSLVHSPDRESTAQWVLYKLKINHASLGELVFDVAKTREWKISPCPTNPDTQHVSGEIAVLADRDLSVPAQGWIATMVASCVLDEKGKEAQGVTGFSTIALPGWIKDNTPVTDELLNELFSRKDSGGNMVGDGGGSLLGQVLLFPSAGRGNQNKRRSKPAPKK